VARFLQQKNIKSAKQTDNKLINTTTFSAAPSFNECEIGPSTRVGETTGGCQRAHLSYKYKAKLLTFDFRASPFVGSQEHQEHC
jgi:hypothetical protein